METGGTNSKATKKKLFPFSLPLTFNTLMGKERELKSKMEMVINMLMLGCRAGKSYSYSRPSSVTGGACVWGRDRQRKSRQEMCTLLYAWRTQHTLCTGSKQHSAACERATFLIHSATGESAKGLLLAHWWDKKLGRRWQGCVCVFQRLAEPAFFQ